MANKKEPSKSKKAAPKRADAAKRPAKEAAQSVAKKQTPKSKQPKPKGKVMGKSDQKPLATNADGVVLLSGGNPQIKKGDGDGPVQAYIAAMPGWKAPLGKQLDALICRCFPNVVKAVRWNSPFYGIEGNGFFVSYHVFTKFLKVTFFKGTELRPIPPGGTPKSGNARWIDIFEKDGFDEAKLESWIRQAGQLPGWSFGGEGG